MRNSSKNKKLSHARGPYALSTVFKTKKRPRGKPWPKGQRVPGSKQFVKGQSGNPGGRPRSKEVSKASREWLAGKVTADELKANRLPTELLGMTRAEVVAWVQGQDALRGSLGAAEFVSDRAEGKPRVSVGFESAENPIDKFIESTDRLSKRIGPPEAPPEVK